MICLIRNLTSVAPPTAGFDNLPSLGDISPGADLSRIKYYRNYLAHLDDNKIDNSKFSTAWTEVSDAVGRLGGSAMSQECYCLKTKILDKSNIEILLEIKKCIGEVADLKQALQNHNQTIDKFKADREQEKKTVKKLKIDHERKTKEIKNLKTEHELRAKEIEKLKDPVPWNIREQILRKLDNWKKDDQMFVDTRGASHVLQCIKTNSFVTVTGSSGVGKTFIVRHTALQMAEDGYDILPVTSPGDIVKFNNPTKKTLYVIDDLCGTYTLNQTYFDKWKTKQEEIEELLKNENNKIIASCRLQIYQDDRFKLTLFTACECNLLSEKISLSINERQSIAEKYLNSEAIKIREYIQVFDFFPLLCKLYNETQNLNVQDFFENPFAVYDAEINKLLTEKAYGKFCALALCVMFNNQLQEEWLTDDINKEIQGIIENTCESCRLNRGTSRLLLRDELDSLTNTFLKKEQGYYRTIHDKLFDFLSFYFGKEMILCLIRNGDSRLIAERFLFEGKDNDNQFSTIVPVQYQQIYFQRMLDDWSKGEVVLVFTNINMKSQSFRGKFLKHLKTQNKSHQRKLAHTYDNVAGIDTKSAKVDILWCRVDENNYYGFDAKNCKDLMKQDHYPWYLTHHDDRYGSFKKGNWYRKNTPLLHCCDLGDIKMTEWCCNNGCDVNFCSSNDESPLYIACGGGYIDIVTMLLENKADINKCTWNGESSLYKACLGGFSDVVTKLVDNKADINICALGESPLFIACMNGFTDIVTTLVDNKANINKCTDFGESPLYVACKMGYIDIVNKLVDNKADINQCKKNGETPLYVACDGGHADIVSRLVDNKVDINNCTESGKSPLYVACKGGYTDIVTKLVDNKADINKCTDNEESPLYIACMVGFTHIVTKLVDNKADINKCTYLGESPLYIACMGGFTDIVTKLVDNMADVNQCTWNGESPLYMACKQGFIQLIEILLNKGADYTKRDNNGKSALDVAEGEVRDAIVDFIGNHSLDQNFN